MNPLAPFSPCATRPWDRAAAAHLLRRAGFAPTPTEAGVALDASIAGTVAQLCDPGAPESARCAELDELGETLATRKDIAALRGWWLLRMRHTARPLAARLALLWHNHFATSDAKVRNAALMYGQLRTIERLALGKFDDLCLALARDPAMILWLDNQQNAKARPNENFARELFELFTLGVGNYSERDIREAARAFTGWHERGGAFCFSRGEHDDGEKVVFGQRGRFDGGDIVRLTLAQPACSRFIASKLLREFVCPQPPTELIDATAARLRETGFHIGKTLETLLRSEAFFDPQWRAARIKSPVEFVLGIVRCLDLRVSAELLGQTTSDMGQRLLEPPSVKGWDGHRAWLSTATMLVRISAAAHATTPGGVAGFDPAALRARYAIGVQRDEIAEFCTALAFGGPAPQELQAALAALPDDDPNVLLTAGLRLLLSSPEYQMA